MGIEFDNEVFNQASNEALQAALVKTATERLKASGPSVFSKIIEDLRQHCVDKTEIDKLEAEINRATDKNETIIQVLKKGGAVADCILNFLKK